MDASKRWWKGVDSNHRTHKRADLQSAAINHSATFPQDVRVLCLIFDKMSREKYTHTVVILNKVKNLIRSFAVGSG